MVKVLQRKLCVDKFTFGIPGGVFSKPKWKLVQALLNNPSFVVPRKTLSSLQMFLKYDTGKAWRRIYKLTFSVFWSSAKKPKMKLDLSLSAPGCEQNDKSSSRQKLDCLQHKVSVTTFECKRTQYQFITCCDKTVWFEYLWQNTAFMLQQTHGQLWPLLHSAWRKFLKTNDVNDQKNSSDVRFFTIGHHRTCSHWRKSLDFLRRKLLQGESSCSLQLSSRLHQNCLRNR